MNYRNRLAELAGTNKLVAYSFQNRPGVEFYATVKMVGADFVEFNQMDRDLNEYGVDLVPLAAIASVTVDPKHLNRKWLERCLALEAIDT